MTAEPTETAAPPPRRPREPRQGILPFVIRHGNGEEVTAHAGLPLVVEAARAVRLEEVVEAHVQVAKRQRGFSATEKLEALLLLVAGGGDRVEDIRILAEDQGLERLLGRPLPSPDALLDFLQAFDDPAVWAERPADAGRPEGRRPRRRSTMTARSSRRTSARRWWPTRGRGAISPWWQCGWKRT